MIDENSNARKSETLLQLLYKPNAFIKLLQGHNSK